MSDMLDKMKMMAEALRGKKQPMNPQNPKLYPVEKRARGYQIYKAEQETMGETAMPYEEWIKTQD